MIRVLRISLLVAVLVLAVVFGSVTAVGSYRPGVSSNGPVDQGCVNQGTDRRLIAPVVCGLQRELSWKSENPPHLFRVGNRKLTHVEVAWPPYLVVNSPYGHGHWHMFRMGVRYDRTWHGYIFPTAAFKSLDHPVQY
jgi:hypothetical protein